MHTCDHNEHVYEDVGYLSVYSIHVSFLTSANNNDNVLLNAGKSTKGTLAWASSPSSNSYSSLSPHHASFLPPSVPLFLVSWWGDPDVKGGLGQEKEREKEKEREGDRNPHPHPHPPWWQTSLSKTFWTRPLDKYTQTIMHTKQWSPSRRQGSIVYVCVYVYVCI